MEGDLEEFPHLRDARMHFDDLVGVNTLSVSVFLSLKGISQVIELFATEPVNFGKLSVSQLCFLNLKVFEPLCELLRSYLFPCIVSANVEVIVAEFPHAEH